MTIWHFDIKGPINSSLAQEVDYGTGGAKVRWGDEILAISSPYVMNIPDYNAIQTIWVKLLKGTNGRAVILSVPFDYATEEGELEFNIDEEIVAEFYELKFKQEGQYLALESQTLIAMCQEGDILEIYKGSTE